MGCVPPINRDTGMMFHMAPSIHIRNAEGVIELLTLDASVLSQLGYLPEHPERYFDLSTAHESVAIERLVANRARSSGIISANSLMQQAAAGLLTKRAPISIENLNANLDLVVDGNSTFINAVLSGWSAIPCARVNSGASMRQ